MRAGICITARLKSTRLPYKVMREIKGKPMIVHMIRRLKLAKRPEMIIVSTSTNAQDNPLVEIARAEGVEYFRGHEDDVLLRLYDAACHHGIDCIINCTADNPFVDPVYIDKLIEYHTAERNDFTRINGLPHGVLSYAVNRDAIKKVLEMKSATDTETWAAYFTETGRFKTGVLEVDEPFYRRPDLRLTVDYREDLELVTKIFEKLYSKDRVFSLKEILTCLDECPELLEINRKMMQKPLVPIKLKKGI